MTRFTGTPLITTIAVPPPSILRGKTIEEIVNKWTSDLDNHIREFNKLAGEVAVWDRALMENGNNVSLKSPGWTVRTRN
jgi:nuclear pore complex protein Nup62